MYVTLFVILVIIIESESFYFGMSLSVSRRTHRRAEAVHLSIYHFSYGFESLLWKIARKLISFAIV